MSRLLDVSLRAHDADRIRGVDLAGRPDGALELVTRRHHSPPLRDVCAANAVASAE